MLNNIELMPEDLNPIHVLLHKILRGGGTREPVYLTDDSGVILSMENGDELIRR